MNPILKSKNYKLFLISAGTYLTDAGASMAVLPKAVWSKNLTEDERYRIPMALNCLLIQNENTNILVDTGIGSVLTEKQIKIYNPSKSALLENLAQLGLQRDDIHHVILTHLHFDHIGGILFNDHELTFPNAYHHIQKLEWFSATNPDELNVSAYPFQQHLSCLSDSFKLNLLDGNTELLPGISLILAQGHSEGMQIVKIEDDNFLAYYAGDIIPSQYHVNLPVISAYDLCRKTTFKAKKRIMEELRQQEGYLILDHDSEQSVLHFKQESI